MVQDTAGTLLRLAAFSTDPAGGNPAGVRLGDVMPPDDEMAFLVPDGSGEVGRFRVRYFSPLAEVTAPASFEIVQGVEMGRPSRLTVSIVAGEAGVRVSGNAVPI